MEPPGELERAEEFGADILRLCVEVGGVLTGEHGVGVEKRAYMPEMFGEVDLDVMAGIRRAIDPQEIANQGKVFPGGEAPALRRHGQHPLEAAGVISRM